MSDETGYLDGQMCPYCAGIVGDSCFCYGDELDDDFLDDPNLCPDCGGDIDFDGYCTMIECGYSIESEFVDDGESEDGQ